MGITNLEERLNGGLRSNRFRTQFSLPDGVSGDIEDLSLLAKAPTIPGKQRGTITVNRSGEQIRLPGDRTVTETWDCEFYLPNNVSEIIGLFNSWYDLNGVDSKVTMNIELLNVANEVTQRFELTGVRIVNLPDLSMSDDSTDELLLYPVTFSVDFINPA